VFKVIILLKKKEGLSDDDFAEHWKNVHGPMARELPGLRRYVQNLARSSPSREPSYHGVAEMWFDDLQSMNTAFATPEGQSTIKDLDKFVSNRTTLFVNELTILEDRRET
jgi:uncharacterized protein (TIGR02118 family)